MGYGRIPNGHRATRGVTWLRYDVDHFSRRTGSQHYPVSMVTTPCQFGGSRWPNGGARFLSRGLGAYRLAYTSQRRGPVDRVHERCRRLDRVLPAIRFVSSLVGEGGAVPPAQGDHEGIALYRSSEWIAADDPVCHRTRLVEELPQQADCRCPEHDGSQPRSATCRAGLRRERVCVDGQQRCPR